MASLIDRILARVDVRKPHECWPWIGPTNKGYGRIKYRQKKYAAHRTLLIHATGTEQEVARHRCDNPPCCNPAHLEWGTGLDNVADREARMRGAKGVKNGQAALTTENLTAIRKALESPYWGICTDLAEVYGVKPGVISRIKLGKTYKEAV